MRSNEEKSLHGITSTSRALLRSRERARNSFKLLIEVDSMGLLRGYGKGNNALVEKAVNYAKTVILDYHSIMGEGKSQQIRVFVDDLQGKAIGELNRAYEKVKLAPIDLDDDEFKFVDDRIMARAQPIRSIIQNS